MKYIAMFILAASLCGCYKEEKAKISGMGYDVEDVRVFLEGTTYDYSDFLSSSGLRAQYGLFHDGKSSDFMAQARSKHSSDTAQGQATMATGIALLNMSMAATK